MCRLGGALEGEGVSYRMLETAAWADQEGGASEVGRGYTRLCRALYASAEVEDAVDSARWCWSGVSSDLEEVEERTARVGRARRAFREAIVMVGRPLMARGVIVRFAFPLVVSIGAVEGRNKESEVGESRSSKS